MPTVHLDRGKVAVVLSPNAHPAMSRGRASRFEAQVGELYPFAREGIKRVDRRSTGIVYDVGFGGVDEVPELVVAGTADVSKHWPAAASHPKPRDLRDRNFRRIEYLLREDQPVGVFATVSGISV
jgi:hypothetical protein